MRGRRRADEDRVDVGALDDVLERGDGRPGRLRKRRRGRRVRVGDRHEPGCRMSTDVAPVQAPDAPGAENCDPDHGDL